MVVFTSGVFSVPSKMFNGTPRFRLVDAFVRGPVFLSSVPISCIGRLTDSGLGNVAERVVSAGVGNSTLWLSAMGLALTSILCYRGVANCAALILSTPLSL